MASHLAYLLRRCFVDERQHHVIRLACLYRGNETRRCRTRSLEHGTVLGAVDLGLRQRVGGQQRRHHLDGSATPQSELQRQPSILRSAAASE